MSRIESKTIAAAPSWVFRSDLAEAALTQQGGHLAPVFFRTPRGVVQPFAIAPWMEDACRPPPGDALHSLRGDFFCLPFGGNETPWRGERHPAHGETAVARWRQPALHELPGATGVEFSAMLRTRIRLGKVTKRIHLRHGETNLYCRHELCGYTGPLNLGHHAMLVFPDENGPGHIALSPWREGRVLPIPFESPAAGGYSSLKPGAPFRTLKRVPLAAGGFADLTTYPAREGFEDLVMLSSRRTHPGTSRIASRFAWTTVTFPHAGWLWFTLKDPLTLASTVLWHSNGGRHYVPWSGRHRRVLGLEEVTSYFHLGLAASASPNPLSRAGIPTVLKLRPKSPLNINIIMGVVAIPRGFDRVEKITPVPGGVLFRSVSKKQLHHSLDLSFLEL